MTTAYLPAETRRRIRKLRARDVATLRELHDLVTQLHQGAGPPDRYRNLEFEQQTGERAVYGVAGLNVALAELERPMEPVKAIVYAAMILFGEAWPRVFDVIGTSVELSRAFQTLAGDAPGLENRRATRAAAGRPIPLGRALRPPPAPLAPPAFGIARPALSAPDEE